MADEEPAFYVCLWLTDGEPIAHGISLSPDFNDQPKPHSESSPLTDKKPKFEQLFRDFEKSLLGYIDFVPLVIGTSSLMAHALMIRAMRDFLRTHCINESVDEKKIVYGMPSGKVPEFNRISRLLLSSFEISREVPRVLTMGLIASFEHYIARLVNWYLEVDLYLQSAKTRQYQSLIL